MERGTVKTRTILIASRGKMRVYQATEDVPPALRKQLLKSTSGTNCGTVLIADRRGLQELVRAGVRQRSAARPAARPQKRQPRRAERIAQFALAHWPELGLSGALAVLLWLALVSFK